MSNQAKKGERSKVDLCRVEILEGRGVILIYRWAGWQHNNRENLDEDFSVKTDEEVVRFFAEALGLTFKEDLDKIQIYRR